MRDAVRLDPGSVLAHVHLGMALHRNNQQSEATAAFEKALSHFPKSPDVLNYYGEVCRRRVMHAPRGICSVAPSRRADLRTRRDVRLKTGGGRHCSRVSAELVSHRLPPQLMMELMMGITCVTP